MLSPLSSPGKTPELCQKRQSLKDQQAGTRGDDSNTVSTDDIATPDNLAGPSSAISNRLIPIKRKPSNAGQPSPGIIYISRLPPGMTPQKVKHLMSSYGDIGKVYAQRSDASTESSSKPQHKKHQSANFTEAWLEFMDKRIAKTVAPMLNAQLIGGKKGDKWRDDIWTMRYLSGFRWEMLGEQVAYERQAHQARLRQSLSQSKTEQTEYLKNVELARVLEKRRAKQNADPDADEEGGSRKRVKTKDDRLSAKGSSVEIKGAVGSDKARRTYKQRELAEGRANRDGPVGKSSGNTSNALQGVLNDLF